MVWGGGLSGAISAYPVKGTHRTICDGGGGVKGDDRGDRSAQSRPRKMTFVPIVETRVGSSKRMSERGSVASMRQSIIQRFTSLGTLSAPDAMEPRGTMFQGFSSAAASLFTPRDKDGGMKVSRCKSTGDVEVGDAKR